MADSDHDLENSVEMRGDEGEQPRASLAKGEAMAASSQERQQEQVLVLLRDEEHPKQNADLMADFGLTKARLSQKLSQKLETPQPKGAALGRGSGQSSDFQEFSLLGAKGPTRQGPAQHRSRQAHHSMTTSKQTLSYAKMHSAANRTNVFAKMKNQMKEQQYK